MNHLQAIVDGFSPSEEHIRVLEAYRREFGIPIGLAYSTAAVNRAVDWWNADCPSASRNAEGRIGDAILRYLAAQLAFAGDPNDPTPHDLWVCREGDRFTIQQPIAQRILASLDLLNAELFDSSQLSFADGVFRVVDSAGFVAEFRPLGIDLDRREVVFERIESAAPPVVQEWS